MKKETWNPRNFTLPPPPRPHKNFLYRILPYQLLDPVGRFLYWIHRGLRLCSDLFMHLGDLWFGYK